MGVAWKEAIKEFEAQHPGVKVKFEEKGFEQIQKTAPMVLNSNVTAQGSRGGGVDLIQDSTARILRTTFAGDSAVFGGGALGNVGTNMTVTGSRFYNNKVAAGIFSQQTDSHGASIFTTPDTNLVRDVTGTVSSSTFRRASAAWAAM